MACNASISSSCVSENSCLLTEVVVERGVMLVFLARGREETETESEREDCFDLHLDLGICCEELDGLLELFLL